MLNYIFTLVFLCSAVVRVQSCDWLRIYGDLSNDSMSLLDQMVSNLVKDIYYNFLLINFEPDALTFTACCVH